MKNITLYVGRLGKSWEGKPEWFGDLSSTGLTFESVEDAMKVIEIAKPEVWRIVRQDEDAFSSETLAEHPLITETLQRDKQEKEEFIAKQHAKVKEINSLPKTWTVFKKSFGNSEVSVEVERTEASFDPQRSSKIYCSTSTFFKINGTREEFYLSEYQASDGKILKKKFIEVNRTGLLKEIAPLIVEHLPTIFKEIETIKKCLK